MTFLRSALLLAVLVLCVVGGAATVGTPEARSVEVLLLAKDSPLAADLVSLYGVAADGRALLYSPGGSLADWQVLARRPVPGRITGLAYDPKTDSLFLADAESQGVYRINLPSLRVGPRRRDVEAAVDKRRADEVYRGPPFREPRDLAVVPGLGLLVADPLAHAVHVVGSTGAPELLASDLPQGAIHVAGDRTTTVIVSPNAGEVRQPAPYAFGTKGGDSPRMPFTVWPTRSPTTPVRASIAATAGLSIQPSPILRPSAPALARGSLYLLDEADGSAYVTYRQTALPLRIAPPAGSRRPSRLLALNDSLLVLDAARGVVERWPLPVPTEFELGRNPAAALDGLIGVLSGSGLLPARELKWSGSLDTTLLDAGLTSVRGPVGAVLAQTACALNPSSCANDVWAAPGPAGTILVADLLLNSVSGFEPMSSSELGSKTLGEVLASRVSAAPERLRNDLWALNGARLNDLNRTRGSISQLPTGKSEWSTFNEEAILGLRQGDLPAGFTLTVPVERTRAFVALPASFLAQGGERLAAIRARSQGFAWRALDDSQAQAKSQAAQPPPPPQQPESAPCVMTDVSAKELALRDKIQLIARDVSSLALKPVNVSVMEGAPIDAQHPVFNPNFQRVAFLTPGEQPPAKDYTGQTPTCRPLTQSMAAVDHATAVAGLITTLAPNATIVPMRSDSDSLEQQNASAWQAGVRIFNFSAHYGNAVPPPAYRNTLKVYESLALFVVAAGNEAEKDIPVCDSENPYPAYPVCEGYRRNVLVVAATDASGTALIADSGGSNWNPRLVQIAAPGEGYLAPASGNSYMAVRGTSFAAPLVTATAAILHGEGIQDPWRIKQRIIATADARGNLAGKVMGGGLLNARRAIAHPTHSILAKDGASDKVVDLSVGDITIKWQRPFPGSRTMPLGNVRRLTKEKQTGKYRIIYYDDVTETLVVQGDVDPAEWPIQYRAVDPTTGFPTGPATPGRLNEYSDYVGPAGP